MPLYFGFNKFLQVPSGYKAAKASFCSVQKTIKDLHLQNIF